MLPEFVQAVEDVARDIVEGIHTVIPGKIVKFDSKSCTATIQPIGKYVLPDGEKQDYPQLTEVPFCMPYSNSVDAGIAVPVKAGDSCLVLFSEIELDEWRTGAEADVEDSLRFDLTNAIAIPGLLKRATSLTKKANQNNAVVVGAGSVNLMVTKSGVSVTGNLSVSGSLSVGSSVTASSYHTWH